MHNHPTRRATALRSTATLLLICLALGGSACEEEPWDGPPGDCWMGIDTLYTSGRSVADTAGVRRAFEAYTAYVDTTDAVFRDGSPYWEYETSAYDRAFEGRRYWKVWHCTHPPEYALPQRRRTVEVDENGTVVHALGCI